jgi:hypothetical protein
VLCCRYLSIEPTNRLNSSLNAAIQGDCIHEIYYGSSFNDGHVHRGMCRKSAAAGPGKNSDQNNRLSERGKTTARQTVRGMPFLLQFALPAETRLL